jgi:hypothetical protein
MDLDTTARRARRLFGTLAAGTAERGALESAGGRAGLPGETDRRAIARSITRTLGTGPVRGLEPTVQADAIAADLVARARRALERLAGGAADGSLTQRDAIALEAVIHTRGRPALRVMADDLEDPSTYPGAEIWATAVDNYRTAILAACSATAAVRVTDSLAPNLEWVQGTAWLVSPKYALTNRHVLFPPLGGMNLARRVPGTSQARLKADLTITADFAFDGGSARDHRYRLKEVPFVAAEQDPVDAALLEVERIVGPEPAPLALSKSDPLELNRIYVIGHPGRMESVPAEVRAVFGEPDERKRVSLGEVMDPDAARPNELIHDASTIGGYSGGCVFRLSSAEVQALHYWGDAIAGNRAITSAALRGHAGLGSLLA